METSALEDDLYLIIKPGVEKLDAQVNSLRLSQVIFIYDLSL